MCVTEARTWQVNHYSRLGSFRIKVNSHLLSTRRENAKNDDSTNLELFHLPNVQTFRRTKSENEDCTLHSEADWRMFVFDSHRRCTWCWKKKLKRTPWIRFWLFVELARRMAMRCAREHNLYAAPATPMIARIIYRALDSIAPHVAPSSVHDTHTHTWKVLTYFQPSVEVHFVHRVQIIT